MPSKPFFVALADCFAGFIGDAVSPEAGKLSYEAFPRDVSVRM